MWKPGKKSSAGTWNSQFTDRQTTSNLADAERNCEDGCQRLYKTSPVFHKKVRKKKYVLWMCSENICKWGVSFHFLSFWKRVLLHLHGVKKWEFLKPVFRLDKKEEKCSLTQSIAINSCLIHEKIKRCTYACWAHSKQTVSCIRRSVSVYLMSVFGSICFLRVQIFFYSHCRNIGYSFEAGGVTDHLIQSTDDVCEAGSHVAVFLPTVQHQLVQGAGAVHGWWQTVVLLNSINYLWERKQDVVSYKWR